MKRNRPSCILPCAFFLIGAVGLTVFSKYFSGSPVITQVNYICRYFSVFLLLTMLFEALAASAGRVRKKRKPLRLLIRGVRKIVSFLTAAPKKLVGRIKKAAAEESAEDGSEAADEDTPPRPAAEPEPPERPEAEAPESEPEELQSVAAISAVDGKSADEAGARPKVRHRRLSVAYLVLQAALVVKFMLDTFRLYFGTAGGDMRAHTYLHVAALLILTVACFVVRSFARAGGDQRGKRTGIGMLTLFGFSGAALTLLATASVMLKLNCFLPAMLIAGLVSVFAALTLAFGIILSVVRRTTVTDFDYELFRPFSKKKSGGEGFFDALEKSAGLSIKSLWSIRYVLKILPGLVLGLCGALLLSTCFFKVESYQNAAVYRFGSLRPELIFGEGLHLKLPWPIDRPEIYDVAREKKMTVGYDEAVSENYLWTQSHGGTEYTLLLGNGNELVSVNIKLVYSIGDLYQYLTRSSAPEELLSAKAYEITMGKTVTTNLDSFLSVDRSALAEAITAELCDYCEEMRLGLRVEETIVENIHPPIEISPVYQSVVSAGVKKTTLATNAESKAIQTMATAEETSKTDVIDARTRQYERVADATQEMAVYTAAFDAYAVNPNSFLLTKTLKTYEKLISAHYVYVFDDELDTSRFVLGSGGSGTVLPAVGWSNIEELMDEAEDAEFAQAQKDAEDDWFGWTDE